MPEAPEPTAAERKILTRAAQLEFKAAQAWLATIQQEETRGRAKPAAESLRPQETKFKGADLTVQVRALQEQYRDEYRGILRAIVRSLSPDPKTHPKLYAILHCAPEEQP